MVVMILERAPVRLRGELTRWMVQPQTGVYVGVMSGLVRDKLWAKVCAECDKARGKNAKRAGAVMIFRARTEQGFAVRAHGVPSREVIEVEGLTLVRVPAKARKGPEGEEGAAEEVEEAEEGRDRAA